MHRVSHFDFNGINFTVPGALSRIVDGYAFRIGDRIQHRYGYTTKNTLRFSQILGGCRTEQDAEQWFSGEQCDKPLLDVLEKNPTLIGRKPGDAESFYSVFKQASSLRFVFLTGVTKFSSVSVGSTSLRISACSEYEALSDISEEELHTRI